MIEIKIVDRDNFFETSMDLFDRYQEVQNVFRMESGKLVLKKQTFTAATCTTQAFPFPPERR